MSFSLSQNKRPTAVSALILSGSLLVCSMILPARATFGQDDQSAESPAAPADEKPDASAPESKDPAPEKPDADAKKTNAAPEQTDADPATEPAEPAAPAAEPAADPEWVAKGVWTLPPTEGEVAVDFSLIGEYVGDLKAGQSSQEDDASGDESDDESEGESEGGRRGVQIRNLGDGEFEARVYVGGLPGQDGYQPKKPMVLLGRRNGQTLVLSGGPWAMFVTPESCRIIDASGTSLATLERAHRESPTLGATPPQGATVLFDGSDTSAFSNGEMTEDGLLKQGADIREMLGDFDLHVEFRIPHMPNAIDQKRGNSGLYLQSRYECQVLDSFGDANVFNGLGALYRYKAPKMNMAFPPLTWQTYDVHFTAARFAADGTKVRNARVTSWVNGVMVQDDEELPGPTGAGKEESPTLLPTKIQNHNDPVRYRNIWVIDRGLTSGIEFPQLTKPAEKE
ncbi:3-keto-disaccharide hydrolase [Allorhodopirellula heiligendammensis]|nr:DUF1080 domain-containing protein [Allorhodopirellula heiligendammensis]